MNNLSFMTMKELNLVNNTVTTTSEISIDGEATEGENLLDSTEATTDTATTDSAATDTETTDTAVEGESVDATATDTEAVDAPESETTDGEVTDTESTEGESVDGEVTDTEATDVEGETATEGITEDVPEGEVIDASGDADMAGMDMTGMDESMMGDTTGSTVKDPFLSSPVPIIGISAATLVVGVLCGILLAKKKIKKGIDLYED